MITDKTVNELIKDFVSNIGFFSQFQVKVCVKKVVYINVSIHDFGLLKFEKLIKLYYLIM